MTDIDMMTTSFTHNLPGVQFKAPPEWLIPDLQASMQRALNAIPPDKTGALVGIATETGVNAAVVFKVKDRWAVSAFIGKRWGKPVEAGAAVVTSW